MAGVFLRQGRVTSIDQSQDDLVVVTVDISDSGASCDCIKACVYLAMSPQPSVGDQVIVNTLGIELGLGTGGYGFVLVNLSQPLPQQSGAGHIVKLRYTPAQISVLSAEEEASRHHDALCDETLSLEGAPVVSAELHSALPAIVAGVKAWDSKLSVCYVMTDGGALPLAFSDTVRRLKRVSLLESTVTVGHAFGGDLDAVNVFSGLVAAKHVAKADVIVVSKGPGIVGTGTPLGHTAMEQGEAANASFRLGGVPIVTPRIGDADSRQRHRGVSHHFESVLRFCTYCPTYIPVPEEVPSVSELLARSLNELNVTNQHRLVPSKGTPGLNLLDQIGVGLSTMGRGLTQERPYFATAAASGWFAARVAMEGQSSFTPLGECWSPTPR